MIPLATTTVSVRRPDSEPTDPWGGGYDPDPTAPTVIASGIRATISPQAGSAPGPGDNQMVQFRLVADPMDLGHLDIVVDDTTGTEYEVVWTITVPDFAGLGSTQAGLTTFTGVAA